MNRRFTLLEAQKLLPRVYEKTSDAVNRVQQIRVQLDEFGDGTSQGQQLLSEIDESVVTWTRDMEMLGVVVKGLWLIDFDSGEGYYCWKYPEPAASTTVMTMGFLVVLRLFNGIDASSRWAHLDPWLAGRVFCCPG